MNWNETTEFIRPELKISATEHNLACDKAEKVGDQEARLKLGFCQEDSYTLDTLTWLAHWMSTDGNHADTECVRGYQETLTPEGYLVFIAVLANACMIEEVVFDLDQYAVEAPKVKNWDWVAARKYLLSMQFNQTHEGRVAFTKHCRIIEQ